jgi:hypothetical protein
MHEIPPSSNIKTEEIQALNMKMDAHAGIELKNN